MGSPVTGGWWAHVTGPSGASGFRVSLHFHVIFQLFWLCLQMDPSLMEAECLSLLRCHTHAHNVQEEIIALSNSRKSMQHPLLNKNCISHWFELDHVSIVDSTREMPALLGVIPGLLTPITMIEGRPALTLDHSELPTRHERGWTPPPTTTGWTPSRNKRVPGRQLWWPLQLLNTFLCSFVQLYSQKMDGGIMQSPKIHKRG